VKTFFRIKGGIVTTKRTPTPRTSGVVKPFRPSKSPPPVAQPTQPEPDPTHGRNRAAAEITIFALRQSGRIETVDSARIAALQSLADAIDADGDNASLWREYRAAEAALREVHDDGTDELATLLTGLSAKVGDTKNTKPTNPRARGSRGG
jgi:hypothetical protein